MWSHEKLPSTTYGKIPWVYLAMLRIVERSRVVRETHLATEAAAWWVGWANGEHAARLFHR